MKFPFGRLENKITKFLSYASKLILFIKSIQGYYCLDSQNVINFHLRGLIFIVFTSTFIKIITLKAAW